MSRSRVFETEEQTAARGRAPPVRQLAAALIDWVILLGEPVLFAAVILSRTWTGGGPGGNWEPILDIVVDAIPWTFLAAIAQLISLLRKRCTLGQRLMRLRVVCLDGSPAGVFGMLVIRSLGWMIGVGIGAWAGFFGPGRAFGESGHDLAALTGFATGFFIAYGSCLLSDRRTLGDKIAGTMLLNAPDS